MHVYLCRRAELAMATSHEDLPTRAREQGVCFHNVSAWASWPVAIQHFNVHMHAHANYFLVTRPSSMSCKFNQMHWRFPLLPFYVHTLLCAPDVSET